MVREGELRFTKRTLGEVDCFGLAVMNRFTPKYWKNEEVRGFSENAHFVRSNGQKITFEWPKVVSKVSFATFWGGIIGL